jgi:RNA polymerase sigma-70 factor (ECF subfamily)
VEAQIQTVLAARQAFEHESERLRPDLHRFCTRMTGSVSDGEDMVQDALTHAFYRLPELREGTSLRAWLFRIAHNRCIDLLRRRKALVPLDEEMATDADADSDLEQKQLARSTLSAIFSELPPKERASVVLKDVLGYSLEETAEITSSNVGAVKAALHRARQKLERSATLGRPKAFAPNDQRLIETYLERFNQRDWEGVRALLSEDARLEVMSRTEGPFHSAYFQNYSKLSWEWRLGLADVEGTTMLVHFRRTDGEWRPHSVIVIGVEDGRVSLIRDYVHIDYLLSGAQVEGAPPPLVS